jgi:hypothetical protein
MKRLALGGAFDESKIKRDKSGEFAPSAKARAVASDQAVVNLPLDKRGSGSLDSQIDKWQKSKVVADKTAAKAKAATNRENKQKAKELFTAHAAALAKSTATKSGKSEKDVLKHLDNLVKWDSEKAIALFERYVTEQSRSSTTTPSAT